MSGNILLVFNMNGRANRKGDQLFVALNYRSTHRAILLLIIDTLNKRKIVGSQLHILKTFISGKGKSQFYRMSIMLNLVM
jgi:hypothetical protein